ncbi:hypothetical protein E4U54_000420 [Claviceps lovelessii]|nr:hypothetical protein E4U54_000420 [Claviceps lovelessii]
MHRVACSTTRAFAGFCFVEDRMAGSARSSRRELFCDGSKSQSRSRQYKAQVDGLVGSQSTYYDRRFRQGPALIRARRPYLFKNAATGLGLMAIVGGICTPDHSVMDPDWYTLKAVGQDDFDDVKVPDAPIKRSE